MSDEVCAEGVEDTSHGARHGEVDEIVEAAPASGQGVWPANTADVTDEDGGEMREFVPDGTEGARLDVGSG